MPLRFLRHLPVTTIILLLLSQYSRATPLYDRNGTETSIGSPIKVPKPGFDIRQVLSMPLMATQKQGQTGSEDLLPKQSTDISKSTSLSERDFQGHGRLIPLSSSLLPRSSAQPGPNLAIKIRMLRNQVVIDPRAGLKIGGFWGKVDAIVQDMVLAADMPGFGLIYGTVMLDIEIFIGDETLFRAILKNTLQTYITLFTGFVSFVVYFGKVACFLVTLRLIAGIGEFLGANNNNIII